MANLLANFQGTSDFSLPQQEIMATEEQGWFMHFDDSSRFQGGGIGLVLKLLEICMYAAES